MSHKRRNLGEGNSKKWVLWRRGGGYWGAERGATPPCQSPFFAGNRRSVQIRTSQTEETFLLFSAVPLQKSQNLCRRHNKIKGRKQVLSPPVHSSYFASVVSPPLPLSKFRQSPNIYKCNSTFFLTSEGLSLEQKKGTFQC